MNKPAISIIIPVYNVEKYLNKCLDSILNQSFQNYEVILVDDGSIDGSGQIADTYAQKDKRFIVLHQKNSGVSSARQKGMNNAIGKYTIHCDSDDWIEPDMLSTLYSLGEETDADIVICDYNQVNISIKEHIHVNPSLNPLHCMIQILTCQVHSSLCNKLVRRELYLKNNITFTPGLDMREDLSVMYRLFYFARKIEYSNKAFYNYVIHQKSLSSGNMCLSHQEDAIMLIKQMQTFVLQQNIDNKKLIEAFRFFEAGIKSDILLFGNPRTIGQNLFSKVRSRHYILHPRLFIYNKFIGFISTFAPQCIISLTRAFFYFFRTLKKYTCNKSRIVC